MDNLFEVTKVKLRGLAYPVLPTIPSDEEWQQSTQSWRDGLAAGFLGRVTGTKPRP